MATAHSVGQSILIIGDFNRCELSQELPQLCGKRTLDKCYGNIDHAYVAKGTPVIGQSDHKVVHLFPKFRQKLKRMPVLCKMVKKL